MKPKRNRMKFRVRTVLKLGLLLVIGIRVGTMTFAIVNARQLAANNDRVTESVELLARVMDLSAHLKDAETAQRGYLITGHDRLPDAVPHRRGKDQRGTRTAQRASRRKAAVPPSRLLLLEKSVGEIVDEMRLTVSVREWKGAEAADLRTRSARVRELTSAIPPLVADIETTERDQLNRRTAESAAALRPAPAILIGTTVLAILARRGGLRFLASIDRRPGARRPGIQR